MPSRWFERNSLLTKCSMREPTLHRYQKFATNKSHYLITIEGNSAERKREGCCQSGENMSTLKMVFANMKDSV